MLIEDCIKVFVNKYKIDLDTLKNIVFDCTILNKTFNKDLDSYIVYNKKEEYLDIRY